MRLKQRIVRILIEEIVADVDQEKREIVLLIHWAGGRHSELRIRKNGLGKHQRCTGVEAIEVVRQMSGKFPDEQIAATLNRRDVFHVDMNPVQGREQAGARYVLVVSPRPSICWGRLWSVRSRKAEILRDMPGLRFL